MFFILSKILLILIQPICWIFYLLLLAALTKNSKRKKRLFFTALGLLYFFSNAFILDTFARWWDYPPRDVPAGKYSCVIVLGGFTSVDENGKGYFNGASPRFIEGMHLKTTGKASKILFSGGSGLLLKGHDFKEADYSAAQLKEMNFPDSIILTENQSRNTFENAVFSKKILTGKKIAPPYLLVTSAFHMRRAMYIFKKAGLDVVADPCDYIAGRNPFFIGDLIIPDAHALPTWNMYIKEVVGYIAYYFKPVH